MFSQSANALLKVQGATSLLTAGHVLAVTVCQNNGRGALINITVTRESRRAECNAWSNMLLRALKCICPNLAASPVVFLGLFAHLGALTQSQSHARGLGV